MLVDVREFRSALPFMLHKRGIRITPLTLEVSVVLVFHLVDEGLNGVKWLPPLPTQYQKIVV